MQVYKDAETASGRQNIAEEIHCCRWDGGVMEEMKLKDFTIYDTPLWLGRLLEEQEERCQRELKGASKAYNEILEESRKLMDKYPFIEDIADNNEPQGPLKLSDEETKALTRFMYLEGERRSWEGAELYLMECHDTLGLLQLVDML